MKVLTCSLIIFLLAVSGRHAMAQTSDLQIETIENAGGKALTFSKTSGIKILEVDGKYFKDLNHNNKLDKYEDWRLSYEERAEDLASRLTIDQIAGLMLYSSHQSIPARAGGYFSGTYDGKPFRYGVTDSASLTDQQKKFLKEDNLRHVLITTVLNPETAARWNNNLQAFCEGIGMGIPANTSSDPRHGSQATAEYNAAAGGDISMWPSPLGMAATFNPEIVRHFGEIAAKEYRALGIATALSPQADMATEPRWGRFNGTFGESPKLVTAMTQAYIDGFQGDEWGMHSVNAMVKHWPGGGTPEAGREPHYGSGKYGVYPGNNFGGQQISFAEGAFKLKGGTQSASAVMPSYNVAWEQTPEDVASNFNAFIIQNQLREKYHYEGVVCTDWSVTADRHTLDNFIDGKSYGVENISLAQRHYKVLMAGVDQFGGNNDAGPILEAYRIGINEHGEPWMRQRMEASAKRLLLNIFRVGLFENPYLDPQETKATVGNPEFMTAGYEAQLKSIVMLKNHHNVLPLKAKKKIYLPKRYVAASKNFLGIAAPASEDYPIDPELIRKYFDITDNPEEADLAIVKIESPKLSIGYDSADIKKGGNGYIPISLQYGTYTADDARAVSLAGGDPLENFTNRSYKGKTTRAANYTDAELVKQTRKEMSNKPVILIVNTTNPFVISEIEQEADAILLSFEIQDQALLETITGKWEPSARLPMQMPGDMKTVELQKEDVPFDMAPYRDNDGHLYDFGFGMNWGGVIKIAENESFR